MRADALVEVRRGLHERLLRRVDARGLEEASRTERRLRVREEALAILREERHILPRGVLTKVINEVSDAVVGLGPIEFLLKDPEVTEVMLNKRARQPPQAQNGLTTSSTTAATSRARTTGRRRYFTHLRRGSPPS
jgi:Flp pilus assembly CpaF family ATPase